MAVVVERGTANLLVNGPLMAGVLVLADTCFTEGAAFGLIMSAIGGALLGMALWNVVALLVVAGSLMTITVMAVLNPTVRAMKMGGEAEAAGA